VHLCIGVPSARWDTRTASRFAVLTIFLAAACSSRLFQNIREKQGLAYAVFSELYALILTQGMMTVYAGTAAETVGQVIDLTIKEISRVEGITGWRRRTAPFKESPQGLADASLESTSSRMSNLARQNCILAVSIRSTKFSLAMKP